MGIQRETFGTTREGAPVERLVLENAAGTRAVVATLGATLCEMHVRDRTGTVGDVTLGFDSVSAYEVAAGHIGCVVGRVANRIRGAAFDLDGRRIQLTSNAGDDHLHGGSRGLDRAVYAVAGISDAPCRAVLRTESPDGDQGYPGRLAVQVTYTLDEGDVLRVDFEARTDARTPVNLTHHAYWNLATPAAGDVLGHVLTTPADRYLPLDDALLPTGEIAPVAGTPLDFRAGAPLVPGLDAHLWLDDAPSPRLRFAAELFEPGSGRVLRLFTTQPGFQLYTGHHLDGATGKGGARYGPLRGVCLEPQHPPDAVHHPHFPSVVLSPGEVYRQAMELRFGAR